MEKLLHHKANPNTKARGIGPVINAAIASGSLAAVKLLVTHNASLTGDCRDKTPCPLSLAAMMADESMFDYVMGEFQGNIPSFDYSQAVVVSAAGAGKLAAFNKLLESPSLENAHGMCLSKRL